LSQPRRTPQGEYASQVPTVEDVVAAWNGPENLGVRTATRPPHGPIGPFRLIGGGQAATATPGGGYEVRVGLSPGRGAVGWPTSYPCFVVFEYASGYDGGPAAVVVPLDPRSGAFDLGRAGMYVGVSTDHRGSPRATHHEDGRLSLV
jgi:hypothetical protein